MRGAVLLAALALAGCAAGTADRGQTDAAEMADTLAGRIAGAPRRCIDAGTLDGPRIIGERLVYRDGPRLWVNTVPDGCRSLRGDPITVMEVHGSQICQNDLFRTIERGGVGIPGPYCRLGTFTPYTRPK